MAEKNDFADVLGCRVQLPARVETARVETGPSNELLKILGPPRIDVVRLVHVETMRHT